MPLHMQRVNHFSMRPIEIAEIENAAMELLGDPNGFYDDIEGKTGERVAVIKELGSKDIIASPGSGKTTTLLAKLLILANRMPFEDGRGICVLTHTNVAIDLIKEKLGPKSSILFSYPNFFGTIQSFVDKYLAIPAAIKYYEKRPDRIENELSNKMVENSFAYQKNRSCTKLYYNLKNSIFSSNAVVTQKSIREHFLQDKKFAIDLLNRLKKEKIVNLSKKTYSLSLLNSEEEKLATIITNLDLIRFLLCIRNNALVNIEDEISNRLIHLRLNYKDENILDNKNNLCGFGTDSGKSYKSLKESIFKKGVLSYSDAYDIASRYLNEFSLLKKIFSERFSHVFIDETQDTADHQSEIIEGLFKSSPNVVIQHFGDPNQAIYDSFTNEAGWKYDLQNALFITESKRFGKNIADIINPLQVIRDAKFPVKGNGISNAIPPYIIVYSNKADASKVFEKFGELIIKHNLHNLEKPKFVALGRIGKKREDEERTISNYFPNFEGHTKQAKEHFDYLINYLKKESKTKDQSINYYSNKIIDAILEFLEKQKIKKKVFKKMTGGDKEFYERRFTKSSLFDYLKKEDENIYYSLKQNIIKWSKVITLSETVSNLELAEEIEEYLVSDLLKVWNKTLENSLFFSIPTEVFSAGQSMTPPEGNCYNYKHQSDSEEISFPIKVNTIHKEKGETHSATLYLETYFKSKYESTTFIEQLKGLNYKTNGGIEMERALKLAYVGMSRPTHMLCIAFLKENIEEHLSELSKKWKIETV